MTRRDGKPCKKCGTSDWYPTGHCIKCNAEKGKVYRSENPNANADWKKENPEKQYLYNKKWENGNARNCNYKAKYYLKNKKRIKLSTLAWKRENKNAVKAMSNKRRTLKSKAGGSFTADEWDHLCNQYDNKCLACGRDDVSLTADHVISVKNGGTSNIENIQPLCQPCNSRKGAKNTDYRK